MQKTEQLELTPSDIQALKEKHLFPTYKRADLFCSHGSGIYVFDLAGKRYLDFLSGISVNSLGYSHPRLIQVLKEQGSRLLPPFIVSNKEIDAFLVSRDEVLSETESGQGTLEEPKNV
jgi:acetylornithine/succinyldiaminopimelate/putrescine aminotransferase